MLEVNDTMRLQPETNQMSEVKTTKRIQPEANKMPKVKDTKRVQPIIWSNVLKIVGLHVGAVYGAWLLPSAQYKTWMWCLLIYCGTGLGVTAGAHRLWSHRTYKAKTPLRVFLAVMHTMAVMKSLVQWVRDHRVHHKFSETDADPHNAKRGFFFSHCGWLMVRKLPDVKIKGKGVDISDVTNDPICAFQDKYYIPSVILLGFVVPTLVPWYFWNESLWSSYFICIFRIVASLHCAWNVNSIAHMWGMRPYNKSINPSENLFVTLAAFGEGFHNYHHTFPQDYSTSEFGWMFNPATMFIDLMAALGQVTDRKKMSPDLVARAKNRNGDGSNGIRYLIM